MANTKSALKRVKTSERRRQRNQAVRSATRTFVKKARTAITHDAAASQAELVAAISALDRAAKKGVIHPNNAARRKSRLMKLYNASRPTAAPAAEPEPAPAAPAPEAKPATRRRTKKDTGA